jgi:hypothetical protein
MLYDLFPWMSVELRLFLSLFILVLPFVVLIIIPYWRIYKKSNFPGWTSLIPIYNVLVFLKIIEKPWYWIILYCIPFVNVVFHIWGTNILSKKFGKDEGFTVGLLILPFIFLPVLGYGKSTYNN